MSHKPWSVQLRPDIVRARDCTHPLTRKFTVLNRPRHILLTYWDLSDKCCQLHVMLRERLQMGTAAANIEFKFFIKMRVITLVILLSPHVNNSLDPLQSEVPLVAKNHRNISVAQR